MSDRPPLSLVTGACGALGTHMCEVLTQAGLPVRAADRPAACRVDDAARGVFPSVVRGLGLELLPARQLGPELLREVAWVFHVATPAGRGAEGDVERVLRALAGARARARLIVLREPDPWSAGRPARAAPPAARSADVLGLGGGPEVTILQLAAVYGPRVVNGAHLLTLARARVLAAPRGSGRPLALVHARDACRAALHVARQERASGVAYDVVDDSRLTPYDYVRLVARLTGAPFVGLPALRAPGLARSLRPVAAGVAAVAGRGCLERLARSLPGVVAELARRGPAADAARLRELGFQLRYPDARRGIRETLTWFQQEGWLS